MEDFERVEEAEGTHRYTVRIVPGEAGGPVVLRSEANTHVRVAREDEIRVLFVQGALTWDFKFIHLSLADDSILKLTGVSRTSERSVFRQGVEDRDELADGLPEEPSELAPFRVVVLAGVDAGDLSARQQDALARYVAELGGGALVFGGPSTFTPGWRGSRLEEMLPVLFEAERGVVGVDAPFRLELTEDALRDSVFRVSDTEAVASVWETLPAFDRYGRVAEAKPGATVWAVHERDTAASGRRILMATQRYGAGITAVVALENFWRWRLDRDGEPEQFDRFWRQLFRYLAQVGRQEVNVFFPGQDLEPGGEVRAVIERRGGDDAGGAVRHRVSIDGPSGATVAEQEVELARGDSATIRFDTQGEGMYQVRVEWPGAALPVVEPIEIRKASRELERTARSSRRSSSGRAAAAASRPPSRTSTTWAGSSTACKSVRERCAGRSARPKPPASSLSSSRCCSRRSRATPRFEFVGVSCRLEERLMERVTLDRRRLLKGLVALPVAALSRAAWAGTSAQPTFFVGRLEFATNDGGDCGDVGRSLAQLVASTSTIEVQNERPVRLEDPALFDTPFVFMNGHDDSSSARPSSRTCGATSCAGGSCSGQAVARTRSSRSRGGASSAASSPKGSCGPSATSTRSTARSTR